jgi:hypothetical protein
VQLQYPRRLLTRFLHSTMFLLRCGLVMRRGLKQRAQHWVGRGAEIAQETLGSRQFGFRQLVDQSM